MKVKFVKLSAKFGFKKLNMNAIVKAATIEGKQVILKLECILIIYSLSYF